MSSGLWYRAAVSEEHGARQVAAIRDQFVEALEAAGSPAGACLFATRRTAHTARAPEGEDERADVDAIFFSPAVISAVPPMPPLVAP